MSTTSPLPPTPSATAQSSTSVAKKAPRSKGLPPPTPSEAAFEAVLARFGSSPGSEESAASAFIERAFAKSDEYLHDSYATIGDAPHFHTKLAGVSFEGRQDVIAGLRTGAALELHRQPENAYDANAIAVHYGNLQLGFLNKRLAVHIAPAIDAGARYSARVASLTGSAQSDKHRGVNIFVERESGPAIHSRAQRGGTSAIAAAEGDDLEERVRSALIGAAQPHDAQRAVLERLAAGKNTLAVLGTGRGKSFCFQYSAALRAFAGSGKTLVVYPLRALANDQFEALRRTLDPLGLRCFRANGSIESAEREELFSVLRDGAWDLVLATPEFLEFHRDALRGPSAPAFAVVDEAHHLHESRHRPAYARLSATIASLGNPQVLALTATAADEAFRRIVAELSIDAWVIDPTVRENLTVVDARETRDKNAYLIELFVKDSEGQRGIVYCNSRAEATSVARRLRRELGDEVMFYHAKMPNGDRLEVEGLFREGSLRVIVATSAFGEGIDLPDVADVVLYHLNFDFGEFNQQAGRAGRDGSPARIHLLYGKRDRGLNDFLIDLDAPPLPLLRELYRGLRGLARDGTVRGTDADIAATLDIDRVRDRTVGAALRILSDSELVELGEDDDGRYIRFLPVRGRVEMERNERYAEGEATREAFARFAEIALGAPATTLERIINRPIYPSDVALRR
ncbi:MAG TPA: helicase-related protein [Candidatus Cybelea sp.]|nr:helicase-related protein [Candidatus Cybelea sp.]